MLKLRLLLKQHMLWVGLVAVVVPLLCILALQYWSLLKLEKTSSVADKVGMKNYLSDVSNEVKSFYKSNAEILNVPAYALTKERMAEGKSPFGACELRGAKRLFVTVFTEDSESKTYFYDPSCKTSCEPVASEARAIDVAAASFKLMSQKQAVVRTSGLTADDRDPENRIVLKPILNEWSKVVGVTGFIIDIDYFKHELLPQTINNSLQKLFPDHAQDNVIVSVYDTKHNLIYTTQTAKGQNDETWTSLSPYFPDLLLAIQSRNMTPEQWARWNFIVNLSLSMLMTMVLIGGIALALRTVSRELKVSQMKTDFVSNVSHELRTPLSSVRVFGEFLRLGRVKEEEKIREYGEYIETESRRLTQLINNILDFSKIESGRKTYNFERADVAEVICETLKTLEVQLKQNGFSIHFEAPRTPLSPAVIDPDAIAQAFMNLLDNAVKYSGSAREIAVRLEQEESSIRLTVTDHGVGIPREEQEKIFEKFYRVSTGLVHDVKGSGLGLSLVKHIVEAHRGRVTVKSEPGRGSSFTIHLPAVKQSGEDTESQGSDHVVKGDSPAPTLT